VVGVLEGHLLELFCHLELLGVLLRELALEKAGELRVEGDVDDLFHRLEMELL